MFNTASDYAINKKNPHAIIYTDAKGNTTVLTQKDFATEEDFYYWKRLSDEDYRKVDIEEHKIAKRTISLSSLPPEYLVVMSEEDNQISRISNFEREAIKQLLMVSLKACLTKSQRNRLWLHYVEGITLEEIAKREGVSFQGIQQSIVRARKNILIFLQTPR